MNIEKLLKQMKEKDKERINSRLKKTQHQKSNLTNKQQYIRSLIKW